MSSDDAGLHVDFAAIWDSSLDLLREQVNVIERTVVAGIERRLDLEGQREAGREAHKLAGSLGTFGVDNGSRLARTLELAFAAAEVLDPNEAIDLSGLVVDLQSEVDRPFVGPQGSVSEPVGRDDRPSMLLVDSDHDRRRRVLEAAAGLGLRAAYAANLGTARNLIATTPPSVVVVDAGGGDQHEVDAFLVEMAAHQPPVATVVLSGQAGQRDRIRSVRAGAGAVLDMPVPPDAIVASVCRLLAQKETSATVLVVDDDPIFLVLVSELLGAHGLAVETLADAGSLWTALEEVAPDLVLLDNDMPDVDGISLCRAIRSDERWGRLPVVFLSGSDAPEVVREMFASGADDFVSKPVSADELITRVANRIRRSRVQIERPDVDLATGLPGSRAFVQDASRLLGVARHDSRPAVLAVVELNPPDEVAMAALGRLLRQTVQPQDAVGRWSGRRLGALLYGTTGPEARTRLGQVLQAARTAGGDSTPQTSIGLAACPEDGFDIAVLGAAAQRALALAQEVPGDAVEVHESPTVAPLETVDVLVVDDDEVLGTLLVHAVSGAGMSVRWLKDGAEAVELLDDPVFRARVVLLDVGLPSLDGLSVLRHLAKLKRLGQTRVVMLTVRTNEEEILEALDLGAFDHVAKPFSLSVLLHRIRRAIEASG